MIPKKSNSSAQRSRLNFKEKTQKNKEVSLKKFDVVIAIDPGTNTGVSIAKKEDPSNPTQKKSIVLCKSMHIHIAIRLIESILEANSTWGQSTLIILEDARNISTGKKDIIGYMGAGSIRRDCSIWEDWLKEMKMTFGDLFDSSMVRPTNNKLLKCNERTWRAYSRWPESAKLPNEHARDSATYLFSHIA